MSTAPVDPSCTLLVSEILARRPKYMLGGEAMWLDTRTHWREREKAELKVLVSAGVSIEKIADLFGRSPSSVTNRCRTDRIKLSPTREKIVRRKPERWVPLAYPYINFRRAENDTLLLVNEMVPRALPGREDVCQDIMLAILESGLTPDRGTVRAFVRKFHKDNYESAGFAVSLDAVIRGTDDMRLIDRLSEEDSIWNRI